MIMVLFAQIIAIAALLLLTPTLAQADDKAAATTNKKATTKVEPLDKPSTQQSEAYKVVDSTKIDFDAANIEGKMKAPMGFMLQGRKSHSQVNMVELRSNFKSELTDSKSAVMAVPAPIP